MKNFFGILILCLILAACAPSGNDNTQGPSPANEEQSFAPSDSAIVREHAKLLAEIYFDWKVTTEAIPWKIEHPQEFKLAQAYILGRKSLQYHGSTNVEVLTWLLEKYQSLKDPSADSPEMIQLSQRYIKKELKL